MTFHFWWFELMMVNTTGCHNLRTWDVHLNNMDSLKKVYPIETLKAARLRVRYWLPA